MADDAAWDDLEHADVYRVMVAWKLASNKEKNGSFFLATVKIWYDYSRLN